MNRKQNKVGGAKSSIVADVPLACADEERAVEFMERRRWGDEPCCPRCGSVAVSKMKDRKTGERNRRYLWYCRDCKRDYTVRIGTVFEDSRIPLKHWCFAFWAACSSKKGVSAKQIQRQTGLSYKSALFMMHRIRHAMSTDYTDPPKLTGIVEADETFIGGRQKKRGWNRNMADPKPWADPAIQKPKIPVMAIIQRGGEVRTAIIPKVNAENVSRVLRAHVDPSARLMTDEQRAYYMIGRDFADHQRVSHYLGEYARGDAHCNSCEGFFALVKRGLVGTFHSVSEKHLHRYLSEFEFRWNTRKVDDGERTERAIRKSEGKRLYYREPVEGAA